MESFERMLTGGHPNSLGRTIELVDLILKDKGKLPELYQCYFSIDEVVRLRTSNAMKRIARAHPEWLEPYIDRFTSEISKIDQASTQWTLATLFEILEQYMDPSQKNRARQIMCGNIEHHHDWIVLNTTSQVLGKWAESDDELRSWLIPHLKRLCNDNRKSVAKTAGKVLEKLVGID